MVKRRKKEKKKSVEAKEEGDNVIRTVIVPSKRLSYKTYFALAEVEREYAQMLRELVDFAYENGITSYVKLTSMKYHEIRNRYLDLPSQYAVTACRDAVTRVKSFLAKKKEGRAYTDKPQFRRITVWLSKELWKLEGRTAVRVATKRGRVTVGLRLHMHFWRYVNGGWALRSEARLKLDHRRRIVYLYFVFEKRVELYEPKGFLPVDVNENNVTTLIDGTAYLLETDVKRITLGYEKRRRRIQERNDGKFADVRSKRKALRRLREGDIKEDIKWKIANIIIQTAYTKRYAIVLEKLGERPAKGMIKSVEDPKLRHRLYQAAFKGIQKAIEEKAKEYSVPIIYINPRNTSKLCPVHKAPIDYDGRMRLGKCTAGGEVWHRDVVAAWNLLLRARGDGSTAPSPGPVGRAARGAVTPPPSAAHDPTRIPRAVWARRKLLAALG